MLQPPQWSSSVARLVQILVPPGVVHRWLPTGQSQWPSTHGAPGGQTEEHPPHWFGLLLTSTHASVGVLQRISPGLGHSHVPVALQTMSAEHVSPGPVHTPPQPSGAPHHFPAQSGVQPPQVCDAASQDRPRPTQSTHWTPSWPHAIGRLPGLQLPLWSQQPAQFHGAQKPGIEHCAHPSGPTWQSPPPVQFAPGQTPPQPSAWQ
jgi:hypothetical protein